MLSVIPKPSPNFDERNASVPLQYLVLHYTDMTSGAAALARLCDPEAKVSAHYLVEEDGRVFGLVAEDKRAWHAGQSFWRGATDLNSASIGIELVNPGHANGYRAFPAAQIGALKKLLREVAMRQGLSLAFGLLGHSDIAPSRKIDPGELFPWQELATEGIGVWPVTTPDDIGLASDALVQELLGTLGYDCPSTGSYDRPTRAALLAFQRRYHPENLTGTPEGETVARIRALVRVSNAPLGTQAS